MSNVKPHGRANVLPPPNPALAGDIVAHAVEPKADLFQVHVRLLR